MDLSPRDLMQASLACFGIAAAALHFAPEVSAYFALVGNGLLVAVAMPQEQPKPRVVEIAGRSESFSTSSGTLTLEYVGRFHSDVMDRLAEGAYYTSSTRRRFLA